MSAAPVVTLIEKIISSIIAVILMAYAAFGIMLGEVPALPGRGTADSALFLLKGLAAYIYCAGLIIAAAALTSWVHPRVNANINLMYVLIVACAISATAIQLKFG